MLNPMTVGVVGHYWTSNFGDLLIRDLMVEHLQKTCKVKNVIAVTKKDYNRRPTKLHKLLYILSFARKCDYVVFGGGGYLESRSSGYTNLHLLTSFALLALFLKLTGKSYCISGPGVGPDVSGIGGKLIRFICAGADHIDVRDDESKTLLTELGVSEKVSVCADAALAYTDFYSTTEIKGHKIALHLMLRDGEWRKHCDAIYRLLTEIPDEYEIYLVSDNGALGEERELLRNTTRELHTCAEKKPVDLAKFLSECSFVITTKLHVGIVSYVVGTPVFNIYRHPKCLRFYEQTSMLDSCISLDEFSHTGSDKILKKISTTIYSERKLAKERATLLVESRKVYEHVRLAVQSKVASS